MASKKLKKLGKIAALAAAAYGASKLGGKKYNTAKNVLTGRDLDLRGKIRRKLPSNLSKSAGPYKDAVGQGMNRSKWRNFYDDSAGAKDGGRMGYKSGGAAKRGFGKEIK